MKIQKADFAAYITSLEKNDLEKGTDLLREYAVKSGTTAAYLCSHLRHRYKIPRPELMQALAINSDGRFSYEDLVRWFYKLDVA